MAGEIVKVKDGKDGVWNLTAETARKIGIKPEDLLDHFVEHYLKPHLDNQQSSRNLTSPQELSTARRGFGKINYMGERLNIQKVREYFKKKENNIKVNTSDLLGKQYKDKRLERSFGMGPAGELQATFYDNIAKFKAQRDKALSQVDKSSPSLFRSSIEKKNIIHDRFNKRMEKLFEQNRSWLPRDAYFDPNTYEDQYGWKPGQSREDFFAWQRKVYADSQSRSRAALQRLGINFDAGHFKALGELKLSKEDFNNLHPSIQKLLKDGGEPDPDNEGGWKIYGTNAASNLAIQIAKHNRANKNFDTRDIKNLLEINAAFTKTMAFQDYLLKDDSSYTTNTQFEESIRSLLGHNKVADVNALISRGYDQLLNEGPPVDKLQKLKSAVVPNTYRVFDPANAGAITNINVDPRRLTAEPDLVGNSTRLRKWELPKFGPNTLSIGPEFFDKATGFLEGVGQFFPATSRVVEANKALRTISEGKGTRFGIEQGLNTLGAQTGNPQIGSQVVSAKDAVQAVKDEDPYGAMMGIYRAVKPGITTQEQIWQNPSHKLVGR